MKCQVRRLFLCDVDFSAKTCLEYLRSEVQIRQRSDILGMDIRYSRLRYAIFEAESSEFQGIERDKPIGNSR